VPDPRAPIGDDLKSLFDVLIPVDVAEHVVTFQEFVTSPKFCNESGLYQFWLDNIDPYPYYSEFILTGSLGSGKTTVANYYLCWRLYALLSKPNLRRYLGLMENSPIYLMYFSISLRQALRSGYAQLINIIDDCRWFETYHPRDKTIESEIRFIKDNVHIVTGSTVGHQISLNVVGYCIDEANFFAGGAAGLGMDSEYSQVQDLYQQLIDRQSSRFSSTTGSPAFAILISSASYQSAFVEKRKQAVEDISTAKVLTGVAYEVKPQAHSKKKFEVFIGTGTIPPAIITGPEHKQSLIDRAGFTGLESKYEALFRSVPEDLRPSFQLNIATALQNLCGVPTQIQGRLVTNMELVRGSYYENENPWFLRNTYTLSNLDSVQLMDYLEIQNIVHEERPHSLFLDLSVTGDSGGLTCIRTDHIDEETKIRRHTHIFTLEIEPPSFPAEIDISKFQTFVQDLSNHVNIAAFGSDQFQSKMLRQNLCSLLGLADTRVSIDSSDEFHLLWLRTLVEGRFRMLYSERLHREISEAIHDVRKHKVIKAKGSTDDVFQSMIGCLFLAEAVAESSELPSGARNFVSSRSVRSLTGALGYM